MYQALLDFKKRFGHCNVPANWDENRQLGRWVATLRFRHKVAGLPAAQVEKLRAAGFIWSPSGLAWSAMFEELLRFRKIHNHCCVPAQWPQNLHLANWVANQRHRKKKGTLPQERVRRLDEIGFEWSIYGQSVKRFAKKSAAAPPVHHSEERLYCLGRGVYIQHDGVRDLPSELRKYIAAHDGEYPPYFLLPSRPTHFSVSSDDTIRTRKIPWSGKGRLPKYVLDYVYENGVLPQHD